MLGKALIIGGTGMLGLPVARQLQEDGFEVTIMSTSPKEAVARTGAGFKVEHGDVTQPKSLPPVIDGHDLVYLSLSSKLNRQLYKKVEIAGTVKVARVCREQGVRRLMLISSATSRGKIEGPIFLTAKVRAEHAVMDCGVPFTIMRPSWFFESLPGFVQKDRLSLICRQSLPRRWLAVADYARQVSAAARSPEAVDTCFYNFGPEAVSIREAVQQFHQSCHPDLPFEQMPAWLARVAQEAARDTSHLSTIEFFEYMNGRAEQGCGAEADRVLGPNATTLARWLKAYCP